MTEVQIDHIYNLYPTKQDCINLLESTRWETGPICPYCDSDRYSNMKDGRFHCNSCNTGYRVTVGTILQGTKLDLQKWFYAIFLFLNQPKPISGRALGRKLGVNKATSCFLLMRIKYGLLKEREIIIQIYNTIKKETNEK